MNLKGTLILSLVSLLERLSYYGVRAILILYATDTNGLNLNDAKALSYYGNWTAALIFVSIPFSLLTDKVLGQRKSIYIGGTLSLIGYSLLIVQNEILVIISIILILAGTSLVKPSTTILIGRQFKKNNNRRTLAYMIFFMGINIGAFVGVSGIGYVGEVCDWKYGFMLAAISTLAYLIVIYALRSFIVESETNEVSGSMSNISLKKSFVILPILVLISIVFWKSHDLETTKLLINLSTSADTTLFGFEIFSSILQSLTSIWAIPLSIVVFFYWYWNGVTSFFKSCIVSMVILIFAILATSLISTFNSEHLIELSLIPLALYAFAEAVISPILTSYVTRVSDVKYSNTIYSTFFFLTGLIGSGFVYLFQNDFQTYWVLGILTLLTLGLLIYKDRIRKLTSEIE